MADSTNSMETKDHSSQPPGPDNPIAQPDPSLPPASSSSTPPATVAADSIPKPNPNPNPNPTTPPPTFVSLPQPPSIQPYPTLQVPAVPPLAQSFRPAGPSIPLPSTPQYSPLPNSNFQAHNFQNHGVQPPGVSTVPVMMPPPASGVGSITVSSVPPMMSYVPPGQLPPNTSMRPYTPMPNGYATMPGPAPPGILRYPTLYASMVRPAFPARPLGTVGFVPALSRPPILGIRGPIIPPVVRPAVLPIVTPTEKPQPTVYVGKISSTVENDFMLSLLQLCGPVKSWNRPQDPTNGALKGFGICEFDSAEGVLRALRLLSKLNVDGQELMLNVNQATKEYLERYVADKKKENSNKANQTEGSEKEEANASSAAEKKDESEDSKEKDNDKDAEKNKEIKDLGSFGLITDEEKETDQVASEKLKNMLEERLKTKPLPPPPPPPLPQPAVDASGGQSNSEIPARLRDGGDSDVDLMRHDATEDRNDDETTSEPDKAETATSPDRNRRNDRRSRDRERDSKRDKERELERLERDREQERAKRERDREYKNREDERRYRARLKEWESRERERDHARKSEREREKEREQERKWEISDQERESEESYSKKRKYKSSAEDRKRRLREKEDDLADRLKEEEEIAEAKRRAEEERELQQKQSENTLKILSLNTAANGSDNKTELPDKTNVEMQDAEVDDHTSDGDSGHGNHTGGDDIHQNGTGDESATGGNATSDARQSSNAPTRKLGFGLLGSGKRTAVPSVFHEEEDEDAQKDKKMRPLVPIDYSTEELQAVHDTTGATPSSNLAAAAEFAKRIANVNNPKEDRPDGEKERSSRRTHERSSSHHHHHRDREEHADKAKTQENRKLLDAKQLIDTIPKTKDELFSYEINWVIYDKNDLHEKMRPWISKKITEFLGEEETTLVDYIVSSTREHVKAPDMLERLQSILDDEAEMFVLKMWRMLIFEIKRVETGLASRSTKA